MPLLSTKGAGSQQGYGKISGSGDKIFVEDVFSTYVYDGNGSAQTITNGIDLAGKGGMVWFKSRTNVASHAIFDTNRGNNVALSSNASNGNNAGFSSFFNFLSNGVSLGNVSEMNDSAARYALWTFRKQPKFFDVVTYTGNGTNRTIAHNLGSVPGCIIVKCTNTSGAWQVYHRSLANTEYLVLNTTDGKATGTNRWNSTTPTDTVFSLGTDSPVNESGNTYVAYLFAHDAGGFGASGSDNVISCGSYTGTGASGNNISLGYEPQWILIKRADSTGNWLLHDMTRGVPVDSGDVTLWANVTDAEQNSNNWLSLISTGFSVSGTSVEINANGGTYIYIAIRRPMKTPTSGTEVFTPFVYTGTNVDNRLVNAGQYTDMAWVRQRNSTTVAGMVVGDRMRGQPYLLTGSTAAEVNDADSFDAQLVSAVEYGNAWSSMTGFWVGNDATSQLNASTTASNQIAECFKRAPGFFDIVCYAGNGVNGRTVSHNLATVPEMMIFKRRTTTTTSDWSVYVNSVWDSINRNYLRLNITAQANNANGDLFPAQPTSSILSLGSSSEVNASSSDYVAYLFASCPGVSKVGSYTGNGSSQTINCGFTTGARFVLIKAIAATGGSDDWRVFDTARGITSGTDPFIALNATSAESTVNNLIGPNSVGFDIVDGGNEVNKNGITYIYLAIA